MMLHKEKKIIDRGWKNNAWQDITRLTGGYKKTESSRLAVNFLK